MVKKLIQNVERAATAAPRFFLAGLVWLFLFSVPVGSGKTLFTVGHYYVVDSRPVHWLTGKLLTLWRETKVFTSDTADSIVTGVDTQMAVSKGENDKKK